MNEKHSLFAYKRGSSFLHRCPAWIKLLFIPAASVALLLLPYQFSLLAAVCLSCLGFIVRISACEQLTDLKPVLYYAVLLVMFHILALDYKSAESIAASFKAAFSWNSQKETVFFFLKLVALMQCASLLFKTSTSLELREGISAIEAGIRTALHLKKENSFSEMIFMFLNFIPMIASIWQQLRRAWAARGGKNGIKMYIQLLPVLFFVAMKKAWNMSRAIEARK